ncbi:MAG: hypothetical protein HOI23_05735 [Deltaproteobacteria bacterium]|nr:hypothetical protein [Deltaproteobacteria bacterium]MBT6434576.1 hypothetical protein [Deltaproteobacteria bacterium]MBT6488878.1 hypothetical protein [Deltaproteobacteria bacterium]
MAENDDGRVESRLAAVGRGFSATPERIAKLQAQAEAIERQNPAKPSKSFSSVLGDKPLRPQSRSAAFRDERKAALPKRGPRPTMAQMGLKAKLKLDDETEPTEPVVIKG